GKAKAAYLTAKVHLDSREIALTALRQTPDPNPGSVREAEAAVRDAEAALYNARQMVRGLGLPTPAAADHKLPLPAFTHRLDLLGVPFPTRLELYARAARDGLPPPANLLPVFSPLDGLVTRRTGVVGETVAALATVYEVGDPTRV